MPWMDIKSTNIADTVYSDDVLVAKDVASPFRPSQTHRWQVKLRPWAPWRSSPSALLRPWRTTITKVGTDLGLSRMIASKSRTSSSGGCIM
jgi:hypothetical protein